MIWAIAYSSYPSFCAFYKGKMKNGKVCSFFLKEIFPESQCMADDITLQ